MPCAINTHPGASPLTQVGVTTRSPRVQARVPDPHQPGLLGLDVLSHVRQVYDFRGRRAWLVPTSPRPLPVWQADQYSDFRRASTVSWSAPGKV